VIDYSQVPTIINQSADLNGIPRDEFMALLQSESDKIYGANLDQSPAYHEVDKYLGYGQLSTDIQKKYGVKDPYDPQQNINAAAAYFADLLKQTGGDLDKSISIYKGLSLAKPARAQELLQRYYDKLAALKAKAPFDPFAPQPTKGETQAETMRKASSVNVSESTDSVPQKTDNGGLGFFDRLNQLAKWANVTNVGTTIAILLLLIFGMYQVSNDGFKKV